MVCCDDVLREYLLTCSTGLVHESRVRFIPVGFASVCAPQEKEGRVKEKKRKGRETEERARRSGSVGNIHLWSKKHLLLRTTM